MPKIDEKRIEFLMKNLDLTREETIQLENDDENNVSVDLTPEQQKVVSEMTRADTEVGKRKGTRKPNETKEAIVRELCEFLAEDALGQAYEDVTITNVNRTITFSIGEKKFELNLIEKRAPKP